MGDNRVRYARNGDARLAYRVWGDSGPVAVWTPGWVVSNVDTADEPASPYRIFIDRFSEVGRFVMWDKRGTGLSDPADRVRTVEDQVSDLTAVMDAVGDPRPTLFGTADGGAVSILYAATHPGRLSRLGLYGTAARFARELPDHPWGFTPEQIQTQFDEIDRDWGDGALVELFHGDMANIPGVRERFGKLQRSIASPAMAKLWWQAFVDIDVRGALSAIQVPTFVAAREGDELVSLAAAKALAAAIPHAVFHRYPDGPHNAFDIIDEVAEQCVEFVCGTADPRADERVVRTVMFTDIVGSTGQLSSCGDARWRHRLDTHDETVERALARHGGVRSSHTGDGYFALFEGPSRAARCALELVPELASRNIPIRVGIHTGECERRGTEWSGLAVHTGARIGAMAGAGEILVSRTVRDLSAGSGLVFESLGLQRLKGIPEPIEVYRVR